MPRRTPEHDRLRDLYRFRENNIEKYRLHDRADEVLQRARRVLEAPRRRSR